MEFETCWLTFEDVLGLRPDILQLLSFFLYHWCKNFVAILQFLKSTALFMIFLTFESQKGLQNKRWALICQSLKFNKYGWPLRDTVHVLYLVQVLSELLLKSCCIFSGHNLWLRDLYNSVWKVWLKLFGISEEDRRCQNAARLKDNCEPATTTTKSCCCCSCFSITNWWQPRWKHEQCFSQLTFS